LLEDVAWVVVEEVVVERGVRVYVLRRVSKCCCRCRWSRIAVARWRGVVHVEYGTVFVIRRRARVARVVFGRWRASGAVRAVAQCLVRMRDRLLDLR
jgi:hypothetical protein